MPSSTIVACRASVMLGSLIALPAAALFWPSFPTAVDTALASVRQGQPGAASKSGSIHARRDLAEAPRFETAAPRGPFDFAQANAPRATQAPTGFGLPTMPSGSAMGGTNPAQPARPLARHEQPELLAINNPSPRANAAPGGPVAATSYSIGGNSPNTAEPANARHGEAPLFETSAVEGGRAGGTTLQSLEAELRRRGATYFFLESWGQQGDQYRFHCKVAVAGNTRYVRHFDATDHDPLAAMRQVLNQVESWQSGRSH